MAAAPPPCGWIGREGGDGSGTVAVATFGNERWLPHLYGAAEDIVLKPMFEHLLHRHGPKVSFETTWLAR